MLGLGVWNPFPLTLGGGISIEETEFGALVNALSPAYSTEESSASASELLAYAQLIAAIWAANERSFNQEIPTRMLEMLPTWEEICRLRPDVRDTDVARRNAVAARLLGFARNTIVDIQSAIQALLGTNFDAIVNVDPSNEIVYWPGVNPGPPGFEWSTNKAILCVRMTTNNLSDADFLIKRENLANLLDTILPAWMTYSMGVCSEFICNQGICGRTLL